MLRLIYRQLTYEPFRTLLTCGAIAAALAVILLLEGFQSGLITQLRHVALNRGADLIVAQAGVTNFVAGRSLLPQLSRQRIEEVSGVAAAHPVTMVPVIFEKQGYRKSPIFFMVYDTGGGPAKLKQGQPPTRPRDIVIDQSLATLYNIKRGDPFVVADFEFRVSGIAEQASALFTAFAFINYDDMLDFFFDSDLVGDLSTLPLLSYLLIELKPGADRAAIAALIEKAEPEADVFTPQQLSQNDAALGRTLFGPVMGVLIGAGYVITLLVIGMIMFAGVHSRLRNFGVMRALGFSNYTLVKRIILESLTIILLAFPLALLFALAGAWLVETRVPLYLVPVLEVTPLVRTFLAAAVLAIAGAWLPYRLVSRLDPALVFRD